MRLVQHTAALFGVFLAQMVVVAVAGETADPVAAGGVERSVPGPTTVPIERVSVPPTTTVPTTMPMAADDATRTTTTTSTTTTTTTTLRPLDPVTFESLARIDTIRDFTDFTTQGPSRWRRSIEGLQEVDLTSTVDGAEQPVFWLPPSGDHDQPVLVILHSWSSQYTQHAGIPYARWAQENGWAVIAPDFRGRNDNRNAVGSEFQASHLAVSRRGQWGLLVGLLRSSLVSLFLLFAGLGVAPGFVGDALRRHGVLAQWCSNWIGAV